MADWNAWREIAQFVVGGFDFGLAAFEAIKRYQSERPKLVLELPGAGRRVKTPDRWTVHEIKVRLTNRSRIDNSVSECWEHPTDRRLNTNVRAESPIDGPIARQLAHSGINKDFLFQFSQETLQFPLPIDARLTIESNVLFVVPPGGPDYSEYPASLRLRDTDGKWYSSPVKL